MEDVILDVMSKSTLENLVEIKLAIRDIAKRLGSPMFGPMIPDDQDDLRS